MFKIACHEGKHPTWKAGSLQTLLSCEFISCISPLLTDFCFSSPNSLPEPWVHQRALQAQYVLRTDLVACTPCHPRLAGCCSRTQAAAARQVPTERKPVDALARFSLHTHICLRIPALSSSSALAMGSGVGSECIFILVSMAITQPPAPTNPAVTIERVHLELWALEPCLTLYLFSSFHVSAPCKPLLCWLWGCPVVLWPFGLLGEPGFPLRPSPHHSHSHCHRWEQNNGPITCETNIWRGLQRCQGGILHQGQGVMALNLNRGDLA